jgi:hypothetical protein
MNLFFGNFTLPHAILWRYLRRQERQENFIKEIFAIFAPSRFIALLKKPCSISKGLIQPLGGLDGGAGAKNGLNFKLVHNLF